MAVRSVGDYNPRVLEEGILKHWAESGAVEASISDIGGRRRFSFLEGPPTANAPPALHHVEMRVFKDLVNRFRFMQGYSVPRKAGWDCHGLPVEVQIEKKLKLNSKKEIVDYGVDKFVEACRESVFSYIKDWDRLTDRMAYWIDLKSPYVTMDNDYIESVWWSLKEIWKRGLLYEGHKVVPYCPRCGTPLSSHEVALGYEKVKEMTVIVRFPAKDREYSFLAWTTTPWTLLSNLALAVHPDITYALIRYRGEKYVLAKNIAQARFPEADVLEEMKGSDLKGVEYYPIFNHFVGKLDKPAWRVIEGDFVTTEEGTGIVHIAPAFGEDDYNMGVANNLPLVNPIGEDGKFTDQVPELKGMFAKEADPKIINWLEDMGALITKYPYEHDYPYCWRCNTPLLYYAMKSWFIAVGKVLNNLIENNDMIRWYPETIGSGRFGNWLENAKDWSLSRNRFWGTPLPMWKCGSCDNIEVVGSRKELREKAVERVTDDLDLHRPHVDKIHLKCRCGQHMKRVDYVIDCWYDSGAATFAQYHYPFENKELFDKSFPYDFISEATDQTRGWFYTLLVLSTILFGKPAYKSCVVGGLLLDDKGEKMSKSKNNIIDPWEMFNTVGADAVRLQMCSTAPWNAKRFGKETLNELVLPFLRTLWNCYSFTVRYMLLDSFDPRESKLKTTELEVEDRWVLSATDSMVERVTLFLERNEFHQALAQINAFVVEDLSRWYIKIIRDRLWLEDKNKEMNPSKHAAYMTLARVFDRLSRVLAPMAPFVSEEIYQNLVKKDVGSVHLANWPKPENQDKKLEQGMEVVKKIFEAGSNSRQNAGIKLRYPIAMVTVVGGSQVKGACESLGDVIKKQLNAKELNYQEEMKDLIYNATPNFSIIGPKYGKDANKVGELIRKNAASLREIHSAKKPITLGGFEISPEMVSDIQIKVPEEYAASEFASNAGSGIVYLDSRMDEGLLREAMARELIRNVQEARKQNNLEELQRIKIEVLDCKEITDMLSDFRTMVLSEVRGDGITPQKNLKSAMSFTFQEKKITFAISFK